MLPTKDEIKLNYQKAPQNLKDYILSSDLNSLFHKIRGEYKIHLDDAEKLSLVINSTILGLTTIEDFPTLLKEALPNSSKEEREKILKEINNEVFNFLRKQIQTKRSTIKEVEEKLTKDSPQTSSVLHETKLTNKTGGTAEEVEVPHGPAPSKDIPTHQTATDPYREPIN